jgi:hypothetical protein
MGNKLLVKFFGAGLKTVTQPELFHYQCGTDPFGAKEKADLPSTAVSLAHEDMCD